MDNKFEYKKAQNKKFEKILIALMITALVALPLIYKAQSYAEAEEGLIGSDGMINQHPGIMRFHVIANSDSGEDQELKLAVRNYVLAKVQNQIANAISRAKSQAAVSGEEVSQSDIMREYIKNNLPQIQQWAQEVIDAKGFDYEARSSICIKHIPAKYYDDLYFPEGNYEALTITLGEGKGQNWWCVVFPPLCLVDSDDSAYSQELGIDEEEKLQLKFKTLELLENSDIGNPTETASCYDAILNVLNITIDELGNTDVNLETPS